jgi:peptidyl-prolyl cis-trans isomerase SurA
MTVSERHRVIEPHPSQRHSISVALGLAILAVMAAAATVQTAERLEEPVAIVGDRLILRSEWEAQVTLYGMQSKQDLSNPAVHDTVGRAILDQMINDQLILIVAERDTTMRIDATQIDEALEDHIATMRRRFNSDGEFQQALSHEGLTERDLRVRFRNDVQNQLLKQKLIQKKLAEVNVSNGEVREFYNKFRDSLPTQPAAIKLSHILLPITASQASSDSAKARVTSILAEIQGGLDFAAAAKQYSQDPTAAGGGDLGWVSKGDLVGPVEDAAFSLTVGQVSGVVKSPTGLHLIQCVERQKDRVHVRHIFLSLAPTAADTALAKLHADSVAQAVRAGADFCELARDRSGDEESRKNCGELGWYPIDEMYPEFKTSLADAKAGDIVGPVDTKFGWHILRVLDRRPEHKFDIVEDWDKIKDIARQDKTNRVVTDWLKEIRGETYVEIRPLSDSVTVGGTN